MAYHKDSKVGEMVTAASDYVIFPDDGSASVWRPILNDEVPRHAPLCARCHVLHNNNNNYYYCLYICPLLQKLNFNSDKFRLQ